VIIAIVAIVVIFGAKKIPEIARSMGKAQSEFKKGMKEGADEIGEAPAAPAPAPTQTQPEAQAPAPQPQGEAQPPAGSDAEGSTTPQ
jgi:sec-independent protein translocase protein TatA